ncbi:hypothetical protein ACTZPA_08005 [Klebsiella pneumoniae]|uniref:hypothetical protein n=1 Tax=Klebsiella pneumoniae TaxID=573 RepID=UPI0014197994|nr:hypothetical protein [Klebsiella pneumoniae]MBD1268155.1 hypothetical protein [Klebsiella pneumoniae]MCP3116065.1 hypothetical protein [Klebsiella pneumoniae]MDO0718099.1 hypothetical protein [Klebsiella pneumoniae]MDO3480826.1 hypothetical protein [Klebsiella pneumoniae]MDO3492086.1 hypothetical protein [Klebsiella pneumoniae]
MTTDITELAQRMKSAAVRAKTATEEYASGHMSVSVCYAECEEFNRLTDGPDNILALVEALEKAQGMEAYWKTQCRGITDHCEELQARIAELESRTVKLPKRFCPEEYEGSLLWSETEVWNQAISACNGALRTAGIKVEDE